MPTPMLHNTSDHARLPLGADLQLDGAAQAQHLAFLTAQWHVEKAGEPAADLLVQLHRANFNLWHQEDLARDPDTSDAAIASVKRQIDRINQQRNDAVEHIDQALLQVLAQRSLPLVTAPLHSETPGLMLDRLSILSLKIFHTAEEVQRTNASEEHRARNATRLSVLQEQSSDLAACLTQLWDAVLSGERRFKLYRQLKMYNDPDLNPVLYRAHSDS